MTTAAKSLQQTLLATILAGRRDRAPFLYTAAPTASVAGRWMNKRQDACRRQALLMETVTVGVPLTLHSTFVARCFLGEFGVLPESLALAV